jgi:integrase
MIRRGIDPLDAKREKKAEQQRDAVQATPFDECRDAFIAAHQASWRSDVHRRQWKSTLETYVSPVFGGVPVRDVDVTLVTKALEPIWAAKSETAARVRGRIERILDWAKVRGYRTGENPARWRGHLDHVFPRRSKVRPVVHHPAIRYTDMPAFMADLHKQEGIAARCLELVILTAARTSEALLAVWEPAEFDLANKTWVVPGSRMKAGREHRVPLSAPAVKVIEKMKEIAEETYIFPGRRYKRPLSNMALLALLERMGRGDFTVHGFRSSFRDWAAECTNFPRELAEAALAHLVGDETERAYQRGDLFEKRRRMMNAWGKFITTPPATSANQDPKSNVVALDGRLLTAGDEG